MTLDKNLKLQLVLLATLSFACIFFGFFISPQTASILFLKFGYWIIFAATLLFVWSIFKQTSFSSFGSIIIKNRISLILLAALTLFLFTREPRRYKVIHDEPNLASTALGLHQSRQPIMAEPSFENIGTQASVDKRPLLFPFLIATTHDLFGYSQNHPFQLNLVLTFFLLVTIRETVFRATGSQLAAWLAILLLCSHPLIAQNSSGGGFEILNLLLIATLLLSGASYLSSPTKETQSLFLAGLILIAHTRYESALFIIPASIILFTGCYNSKCVILSPTLFLCPLLLLPVAWQNTFVRADSNYWQIPSDKHSAFAFDYLPENLASSIEFLIKPQTDLAGSPFLFIIGAISLLALIPILKFQSPIQEKSFNLPFLSFGLTLLSNYILLMFYHWGRLSDPTASRLSLPLLLVLACAFGIAASYLKSVKPHLTWLLYAIVSLCWITTLPIINRAEYTRKNPYVNRNEWVLSQIDKLQNQNYLIISPDSPYFASLNLNCISPNRALLSVEKLDLHLKLKTYDSIYLVQSGHYTSSENGFIQELSESSNLGPAFNLESLDQSSFHPFNFTRLARLKSINMEKVNEIGGLAIYYKSYSSPDVKSLMTISREEMLAWEQSLP